MWEIHSKTWGKLQASNVYDSGTLKGAITLHDVTREGKEMWTKVYLFPQDVTAVIPPIERF